MANLAGRTGIVYIASLLLEDCEDAWVNGTNGTASLETSATLVKVGSGSCKIVGSSVVNGDYIAYESISSTDVSTYTHLLFWARCAATIAAADVRIILDHDAGAPAAPQAEVDVPALTANVWKYCHGTEVSGKELSNASAAVVIGAEWNANQTDTTLYFDDIRAAKTIAGIKSWTLDYTVDMLDTTDFADGAATNNARTFIPGLSSWSGTFEGVKDGAPLTLFSQVGLELAESTTVTQMWLGNVVIMGIHPNVATDGLVTYTYDYQGVGELVEASA